MRGKTTCGTFPGVKALALLLTTLALGCSLDEPMRLNEPPPPALDLLISPTPEAQDVAEEAVWPWIGATGIGISIMPGGIPFELVDQAFDGNGRPACESAIFETPWGEPKRLVRIEITRAETAACPSRRRAALHGIGHALCMDEDCHSDSGVMAPHLSRDPGLERQKVDEASALAVCALADCMAINLD